MDSDNSTAVPDHMLSEPGIIESFKLADETTILRVKQTDEGTYAIGIGGSKAEHTFTSAYGGFAVYAMDCDGDRADEVIVETGYGQGTFVYKKSLTVYRIVGNDFEVIFEAILNDYFTIPSQGDPGGWAKRYRLLRDESVVRLRSC